MSALDNVPGLAGYLQAQQQNQAQGLGQLQQAGLVLGLQDTLRKQAQEQAFRSGLRPDMTQDELAMHAARFAGPEKVMDIQQKSLDRREAAKERALQFAQTIDLKQQALDQQKSAFEQRTEDAQARQSFNEWYKSQSLVLQKQNAAVNEELKRLGLQISSDKVNSASANQLQRQTQMLGTALERANLPEADATLRAVEGALTKNPKIAEYLSGPKSLLPDLAVDQDVREGRQAFQKLFNITLKNRSGAAVTNQELERLKQEFATGALKTPEQLKAAVNQARNIISQHYRAVASGFGPDALNSYNANMREMGGTPLLEPGQAQPKGADPLGIR
ncbi:MAG TPA: hypothetical protein VGK99_05455 [Acidobacteriota bacterium]|jgi:hypothetical protein